MFGRQIKFELVIFLGVFFVNCNSSAKKEAVKNSKQKDTVKATLHTAGNKKVPASYVILDTVAGRDTIKVVLYNNTMIKCSLNNFSDTLNVAESGIGWDSSYSNYSKEDIAPILVPGEKRPDKFILNDSLLLIPVCDGNFRTLLYMLNRTKNSLKFSGEDAVYTLLTSSYYVYIDLKHNIIINYADQIYIDTVINGIGEEIRRYPIFRYKIENRKIVQTNSAASYFKEFGQLALEDNNIEHVRTFYNIIVHRENWEHDRYKLWK